MSERKQQYQIMQRPDLQETMQLGTVLAKSGFFADSKQEAQAVVKVLAGQELGFGPVASMTGINIIKGKVALSANLMAAAIKGNPRYTYKPHKGHPLDTECSIDFFERNGANWEIMGTSTFTKADAAKAGLTGGNWTKYPRNMLFARAISNGAKWFCPDIFGGPVYTPDELGAIVDGETGEVIDGQSWPSPTESNETAGEVMEQESDPNDEMPTNGNVPSLPLPDGWAHLAELEDNPDLEALEWRELSTAAQSDLGYNHPRHVSNAIKGELGADWHKIITKTQAWALLKERKEQSE